MKKVNGVRAREAAGAARRGIALPRTEARGYLSVMQLSFRALGGDGSPIVILHGLFGSSQNWAGMGRRLSSEGTVYALDLRNHGDSPHGPTNTLADCVEDIHDWIRARKDRPIRLIGHSLGGLVAMGMALSHPGLVAGVAALDIAPRPYPVDNEKEFQALRTDISRCRTRAEVDALLAPVVTDSAVRQFLLTNAVRDGEGFRFRLNVEALARHTVSEDFARIEGSYAGPALLVCCGRSGFVRPEDRHVMRGYFPHVVIESIPEADHWPHVSAPAALETLLRRFLARAAAEAATGTAPGGGPETDAVMQ
jgi:esterase